MTEAQKVAGWPRVQVEIRPEAQHVTAVLRINGAPQGCASPTVEGMRAGIIARCAALATTLARPVAVDVDEAGRLIVTDHGSSNGTYVDGHELTPHTPTIVAASAQLQLRDTRVRLQSRTGSATQPSTQG